MGPDTASADMRARSLARLTVCPGFIRRFVRSKRMRAPANMPEAADHLFWKRFSDNDTEADTEATADHACSDDSHRAAAAAIEWREWRIQSLRKLHRREGSFGDRCERQPHYTGV